MGTTGMTAQAVGRSDHEAVLLTGRNGVPLALGLGLAILVLQHPLRSLGCPVECCTRSQVFRPSLLQYFDLGSTCNSAQLRAARLVSGTNRVAGFGVVGSWQWG